jgi:hypothetical protein
MPLSRIPDEKHPSLLVPLAAAKNEAAVGGHVATVKRIQAIVGKLKLYPGQSPSEIRAAKERRSEEEFREVHRVNDANEDIVVDELIEGRPADTVEGHSLPAVIQKLKARKSLYKEKGDYVICQKLSDLIEKCNAKLLEFSFSGANTDKMATLQAQLQNARDDLAQAEQFWADLVAEFDTSRNERRRELIEKNREQLADFDDSYPDMLPVNFRKLSVGVLQLREQEKHLVETNRYQEAIHFHARSDGLEVSELDESRARFEGAFQLQRNQLTEQQESQLRCLTEYWQRRWEQLERNRDHELSARRQVVENLERRVAIVENEGIVPDNFPLPPERLARRVVQTVTPRNPSQVNPRIRRAAASRINLRPVVKRPSACSRLSE